MFIGYAQNSAAYRFMSLKDSFISESSDGEFFKHVFSLKRNVSTTVHEIIPVSDNVPLSVSGNRVRDSIDELRRSKRPTIETSLGLDFLTNYLVENFDVNLLSNELVSAFFIEENLKTYKRL